MNARERFLRTMAFEPCDRPIFWELGYWASTLERWHGEGLRKTSRSPMPAIGSEAVAGGAMPWPHPLGTPRDREVEEDLRLDPPLRRVPVQNSLHPFFEEQTLEEDEDTRVIVGMTGAVMKVRKDEGGMPLFLSFPVTGWESWESLRDERLQMDIDSRLPQEWRNLIAEYATRDYPLCIGGGRDGYFGMLREFMGTEGLFYMYHDDPRLVHAIQEHMTNLWIALYDRVLSEVTADAFFFWEDMAYKAGSLISPAAFREFMLPYYRRMTSFLADHGIRNIIVDTDGNCWELLPLFQEAGLTGVYPFEVQAGMDVVEARRRFPRLQILGGLDKRCLAQSRLAIDQELDRKVPFMLKQGGYVPYADHLIPPDVSWEYFVYYRSRIKEMGGGR